MCLLLEKASNLPRVSLSTETPLKKSCLKSASKIVGPTCSWQLNNHAAYASQMYKKGVT